MKLNKALADGIFVGVFIAAFGTVLIHLTLANMNFAEGQDTGLFFRFFPILFGAVVGFAAGNFAYAVSSKRSRNGEAETD